jgi:hypothetical protein
VEKLAPLLAAICTTIAFQLAFRFVPARRVWPLAIIVILLGTAAFIWSDSRGFTSQSPYPFGLMILVPAVVSGAITHLGKATRWPWPVTTIVGSVAAIALLIPMWLTGCLLAQAMRTPGCHF